MQRMARPVLHLHVWRICRARSYGFTAAARLSGMTAALLMLLLLIRASAGARSAAV